MVQHLKQFSEYLLIGVLAILPIVIVIQVVLFIKDMIAGLFFSVYGYIESYLFTSMLFAVIVLALSYLGYTLMRRRHSIFISTMELLVEKIPFINTIYRVSKKVIAMFSGGGETGARREVVYIQYPKDDIWVPAYVTNREGEWYVLFVPTSPNPTSGFTVVMHESKVVKSRLNIEEVTSFIVSVGADFPKAEEVTRLPH